MLIFSPGQSRQSGNTAVEDVRQLRLSRDELRKSIRDLQSIITNPTSANYEVATAQDDLCKDKAKLMKVNAIVKAKEQALGIDGCNKLDRLWNNPYMTLQMNALALKTRIHQCLISRKFECDRVE